MGRISIIMMVCSRFEVVTFVSLIKDRLDEKTNKAYQARGAYASILKDLKSLGATVNGIKPEFLLTKNDFTCWWTAQLDRGKADGMGAAVHGELQRYYETLTKVFDEFVSRECWIHICLQVIKLFVLNKITIKHLRSLPGVEKDETEFNVILSKSNVFGVCENVLLKWFSYCHHKATGAWKRFTNFDADFRDGHAIASALRIYVKHRTPKALAQMFSNCNSEADFASNEKCIRRALNEVFCLNSGDEHTAVLDFSQIQLGDFYGK